LAFVAFGQNFFENLKSYLYTVSDKIVAQGSRIPGLQVLSLTVYRGILVSSKVRFMWIFAGVCCRGGVK